MHRFFVPPEWISQNGIIVIGEQSRQMKEVLRLRSGDQIAILDNTGMEYQAKIVEITSERVLGEIIRRDNCPNEPGVGVILYQALLKNNKFELILQKCAEMGVVQFVPIDCERCIAGKPGKARFDRWQKIIVEAAEQSRRGKIPELKPVISFKQACEGANGLSLIPWEGGGIGIRDALANVEDTKRISIFIGPEGGFSASEIAYAQRQGIIPVTLGKRILRAETAGMVTPVIVLYELGEMG